MSACSDASYTADVLETLAAFAGRPISSICSRRMPHDVFVASMDSGEWRLMDENCCAARPSRLSIAKQGFVV